MADWTDAIVGDRMTVDREFNQRVRESEFTSQEWGLIMTATDLEIENPDDPEEACLVADTQNLPQIMPELENLRSQVSSMGGAGASPDRSDADAGGDGGGGLLGSIKSAFGLGGGGGDGGDAQRLEAAERLAQEYADELQSHLERKGKWERARIAYQE